MFALLSASYMLGLLVAEPCVSEMENVPGKNETIVYKCTTPGHTVPPLIKDEARVPATELPLPEEPKVADKPIKRKKVAHRCGSKTPVWYVKNGTKRYRCK
jgi:hypothetical protein